MMMACLIFATILPHFGHISNSETIVSRAETNTILPQFRHIYATIASSKKITKLPYNRLQAAIFLPYSTVIYNPSKR